VSGAITITEAAGIVHLPHPFRLELGGTLEGAHLVFEARGPDDGPLVAVLGGISAGRNVASWWAPLVGPGKAIDTDVVRVVGIDWLGGAGASSGPASTGLGAEFPTIAAADQARAIACLLDHLGTARAHAIVGSSFGGMVALAFAERFPGRVARIAAISAAHESHPQASAWRSVQRRILELGIETGAERRAVAIARALAMATYRSPQELAQRFGGGPRGLRLPVEDYLEARGEDFAERFDVHGYRALSLAIDLHRVEPEKITTPTTLVAVRSDQLVPPGQVRDLARRLAGRVSLHEIESLYGHDAFLKEVAAIAPILKEVLS